MEVVTVHQQLNQLQRHHDGQNNARYGKDHGVGQTAYHIEDTAVPRLGGQTYLCGDVSHLLIHAVEHPGEVAENTADKQLFQPIRDSVKQEIYGVSSPFRPAERRRPCCLGRPGASPARGGRGAPAMASCRSGSGEQAGQQGDQGDADEGHAAARHELLHTLALCSCEIKK